ncbi:SRPBCC family protein [Prescottella defluvii]|nr:SRPBCC family protein [Prescottella defluvii]
MRHVVMLIRAEHIQPDAAYARISDFARYPELTDTVLALDLEPAQADGSVISNWLVRFRKGTLRWTERDVLDPVARRIEFAQLTGDFVTMEGSWQCRRRP